MRLRRILALAAAMLMLMTAIPGIGTVAKAGYDMPYYITADLTNQIVTIYSTSTDNVVRQFLCSSGLKGATPHGTYYLPKKVEKNEREYWYYFSLYNCYAHYATRIFKGVLFHSIPYEQMDETTISVTGVANFGKPASHGCLRLRWQDAEFIAKCCMEGTRVRIFTSKNPNENLRAMLMRGSFTNDKGQTYDQFLAKNHGEGVLGNGSKGAQVRDLQTRLRDLGIFNAEIDGYYGGTTVNAVRDAQLLLGQEETGLATPEFLETIYSDAAPTDSNVPLSEGMSGPVVRKVQQQMADLSLYDANAVDGVFDVDVLNAVKRFQSAYCYPTDGILTSGLQKALAYESAKVNSLFAETGYELTSAESSMTMAHTNIEAAIRLRAQPSSGSDALERLNSNKSLIALGETKGWAHVQRRNHVGYVREGYLDFYTQDVSSLTYASPDGSRSYTIGYTADEYLKGVALPWELFAEYLASDGDLEAYDGTTTYARVATDGPGVTLNLREKPNTNCTVLAEVPYETQVRVLWRDREWSLVSLNGQEGYLLNEYLTFWGGQTAAYEAAAKALEENPETAVTPALVKPVDGRKAPVYNEDSLDGKVLGYLPEDTRLEVLETQYGWSHITLQGHEGYMKDADLQYLLAEEIIS